MDQPRMVVNPARGQLNREEIIFALSSFTPENLVSRERFEFGRLVPRQYVLSPQPG